MDDVYAMFEARISEMKEEGRIGNADTYQCAVNSLKKFRNSYGLTFGQITPDFLKKYEKWMLNPPVTKADPEPKPKSITTVGIYLRPLKAIFNIAIEAEIIDRTHYPFGKNRYQIPSGRNVKKALTLEEVGKIVKAETVEGSTADWAKDMWYFSYLCNGMNIKDISRLMYENINGDRAVFIRAKTERTTKKDLKPVTVILLPEALNIIEKWGNKPVSPKSYVFPILKGGESAEREKQLQKQATQVINRHVKAIAKAKEIESKVTTYTARHSFATILKRSGAPVEFISESLGHGDLKTTENYLDSFEDETKREWAQNLTNF